MDFEKIFAEVSGTQAERDKAERLRRGRLAEQIYSQKHPEDPMTLDEARTMVDLAAKIWEDTEGAIIEAAKLMPERLAVHSIAVSVKTVFTATEALMGLMLERANGSDVSCDCPVCEYKRELEGGADPKDLPFTAQLLGMGFRVVDSGDGFIVLEGNGGTFH